MCFFQFVEPYVNFLILPSSISSFFLYDKNRVSYSAAVKKLTKQHVLLHATDGQFVKLNL